MSEKSSHSIEVETSQHIYVKESFRCVFKNMRKAKTFGGKEMTLEGFVDE